MLDATTQAFVAALMLFVLTCTFVEYYDEVVLMCDDELVLINSYIYV